MKGIFRASKLLLTTLACTLVGCGPTQSPGTLNATSPLSTQDITTVAKQTPFPDSDFMKSYSGYDRKFDSDLYRTWGVAGVKRILDLRMKLARYASKNPSCDNVELAEINDRASRPPNNIHIFVDCKNGQRFELSKADLARPIQTEQQKGARFDKGVLVERCVNNIRARIHYPGTFDKKLFTTSARQAETLGNWVVEFDFTAANAFGAKLPSHARCVTTPSGDVSTEITDG